MTFAHNQLAIGKNLRILPVVNTHSQLCPAAGPRFAYHGEDVVQTLEKVCADIGYPKTNSFDNGSEFIFRGLDLWAYAKDVTLDFPRSGKPTDNGFILRRGKPSPGLVADPSSHSTASFGPNA